MRTAGAPPQAARGAVEDRRSGSGARDPSGAPVPAAPSALAEPPARSRRRLLVVTPWWPSEPHDPFGSFVRDQARALGRAGADVRVAVLRLRRGLRPRGVLGLEGDAPSRPGEVSLVTGAWMPYRRAYDALLRQWTAMVTRAVRRQGGWALGAHVLVHTQELAVPAWRGLRGTGLSYTLVAHGSEPLSPRYADARRLSAYRRALAAAWQVAAVGPGLADEIAREAPGARVVTVLNGFDEGLLARVRSEAAPRETGPRFVSVGNLVEGKGVEITIRALRGLGGRDGQVPSYDVVGGGPERASLEALARQLGLSDRIRFHGVLPHDVALRVVRGATAFVLPSAPEACGIAYMEAMALGVPVVAVRGQGPSAFVRPEEEGFLVERTERDVADALGRLLAPDGCAERMGARALVRSASLGWAGAARRLQDTLPATPSPAPRPRTWVSLYNEPTPYVTAKLDAAEATGRVRLRRAWLAADRSQAWGDDVRYEAADVLSSPGRVARLCRDLLAGRYDGLHAGGWGGSRATPLLLASAWFGRRPITLESDTHVSPSSGGRALLRRAYLRWIDRRVRCWLPGGTPQARHLEAAVGPRARVRIERMTTDTRTLASEAGRLGPEAGNAWRASQGLPATVPLLLYVGRIAQEKGLADLVAAVARLRREGTDVALAAVGPGDLRPLLPPDLPRDRVAAPGRAPWRDLVPAYLAADVLVLPSRFEPWGLVVNEALFLGCPVVVTEAVGAAEDLVRRPGAGEVVPVGDVAALAQAVRALLARGGRRSPDAQRGRRVMSSWTTESAGLRLARLLAPVPPC